LVVTIERDLDAELVGSAGLALADTLGLRGREGIELPATLALLLGSDLGGARQRERKRRLDALLTGDLAADVTDQPAKPAAQDAQLPAVAVELLGVGVAPRHHRRALGNTEVGLPQPHSVLVGQAVEPLDGGVQQLGVGREADVLGLHRGIDRDPLKLNGRQVNGIQCPHRNGKRMQGPREHRSDHFDHRNSANQTPHRVAMRILELVRVDTIQNLAFKKPLQIGFVLLQSAYGFVACYKFTVATSGFCFQFFHFHSALRAGLKKKLSDFSRL
jgi:hypothetical protein